MPDIDAMEVVGRFWRGPSARDRHRSRRAGTVRRPTLVRGDAGYVARILSMLQQDGVAESAPSPITARALYRYEGRDRRIAYSNLPIDCLSSASRGILERGD